LIAELGLTSNQSAASRRDAPDSTASTTRSRNSKEHGFGIDPPSKTRINARQIQLSKPAGESRFNSAEIRSNSAHAHFGLRGLLLATFAKPSTNFTNSLPSFFAFVSGLWLKTDAGPREGENKKW
jgi:hypothetical protein